MGVYIYKVTAKTKMMADGKLANIAEFAYKPDYSWYEAEKLNRRNRRWAWKSGCHIADRYVETSKNYTGYVVLGKDGEDAIPCDRGTFTDSWFDSQRAKLNEVKE